MLVVLLLCCCCCCCCVCSASLVSKSSKSIPKAISRCFRNCKGSIGRWQEEVKRCESPTSSCEMGEDSRQGVVAMCLAHTNLSSIIHNARARGIRHQALKSQKWCKIHFVELEHRPSHSDTCVRAHITAFKLFVHLCEKYEQIL